ncbi:40S ribosomal protein S12 [Lemmus lemmus]
MGGNYIQIYTYIYIYIYIYTHTHTHTHTHTYIVEAFCTEHQINLSKVDGNKKLWVGLCKTDQEGKLLNMFGCTCVMVEGYGRESQAKHILKEYFRSMK